MTNQKSSSISPRKPRSNFRSQPLLQTRQAGDRWRERWLEKLALESAAQAWSLEAATIAAQDGALDASLAGHLRTRSAVNELIRQGRLAAHPAVRSEFQRLMQLRDEIWKLDPGFLRQTLHGPSQVLQDLMQRQCTASERHHVVTPATYLRYLRNRFATDPGDKSGRRRGRSPQLAASAEAAA